MIETTTLDNGLRVVVGHRPGHVVYCGLAVDAGTRDQLDNESGMAHFIEHMSFKGTERRKAWHIINRMEAVGGDLNAYTGKEHTVYYCSCLHQHLGRALDLLFDITFHSTYPQHELEKEVEVVIDEIESYNDSPAELIYDDFENFIFPGHPLGRRILGDAGRLRQYRSEDLQRFVHRLYHPSRTVLFVLGDITMKQVLRVGKEWRQSGEEREARGEKNNGEATNVAPCPLPSTSYYEKPFSTHQAHVVVGARGFAMDDPRYMVLYLLNNILGGPGMNARLNLALRERRGLVYTVESSITSYTDTGLWTTYFGCDHKDVDRCLHLIRHELHRLAYAPLSASALAAAKRQLQGQAALSWENGENVAIAMGCRLLHLGRTQTLRDFCQAVDEVTATQLLDVAQQIFSSDKLFTLRYVNK